MRYQIRVKGASPKENDQFSKEITAAVNAVEQQAEAYNREVRDMRNRATVNQAVQQAILERRMRGN